MRNPYFADIKKTILTEKNTFSSYVTYVIVVPEHAAALAGMSGRGAGGQRCQLILQRCLAIQLTKPGNAPDDFWMYDSGYLLFQVCKLQFTIWKHV